MTEMTPGAHAKDNDVRETKPKRYDAASIKEALSEAKTGQTAGSVRLQLTLKAEFAERLEALRVETHASSYSDVIREALRVYEDLVQEVKEGHRIYAREEDGTLVRIKVP